MFRHLAIAALRNMAANQLQSAIAIIGLSIGIAAALLMGLVVRNQISYDHFIPGYERTYKLIAENIPPERASIFTNNMSAETAAIFKLDVPEIESIARLMVPRSLGGVVELKRGEIKANEKIYWADPNIFEVLPLPVFQGDLRDALSRPDGIVITRATARKYFGREDVVGQTIQIRGQGVVSSAMDPVVQNFLTGGNPMVIRAVIEDLPENATSFETGIFASGLAAFSPITQYRPQPQAFVGNSQTFFRLKPGATITELEKKLPVLLKKIRPPLPGVDEKLRQGYAIWPVPIDALPLFEGLMPGARTRLTVSTLVGLLILLIAAINFVNLLTARAVRRAMEVGLRKVCGAARKQLVMQYLGESILTVFFATCVAVVLSEWLLPTVNSFLGAGAAFEYWYSPVLPALLLGVVMLGITAGAYPAFVLSSFRPVSVLKGVLHYSPVASLVRSGLVVLQFAILIGLVVAATVIYQQHVYSTREGLRVDIDQVVIAQSGCKPAFRDELRKLPGVKAVTCANSTLIGDGNAFSEVTYKGRENETRIVPLDWDAFAFYGIKPLAGAFPDKAQAPGAVLNEMAIKKLGFATPQAAVGQIVTTGQEGRDAHRIVAIVPDFTFKSVEKTIDPTLYGNVKLPFGGGVQANIKLKGEQIPETLEAIDRLWTATGNTIPINRVFLDEHLQQTYLSLLREAQLLAIFSGVAVFLACLGLLGLSISTAERRTKEIGIRKAMGASSRNVTLLLLWQFTRPVLLANLIAWPIAFYVMNDWLNGFAHHIALNPLVFVGATLLAILVALLTVAIQSTLVARAVPATALRYE